MCAPVHYRFLSIYVVIDDDAAEHVQNTEIVYTIYVNACNCRLVAHNLNIWV
jgi:hypothetical protein